MRESVFILSCIQYCSYMKLVSFCCLTNIYIYAHQHFELKNVRLPERVWNKYFEKKNMHGL